MYISYAYLRIHDTNDKRIPDSSQVNRLFALETTVPLQSQSSQSGNCMMELGAWDCEGP